MDLAKQGKALVSKSDDLNLIPRPHIVEGENQFIFQIINKM